MTFFYAALYAVTAGLCKVKKNEGIHSGFPSSFKSPPPKPRERCFFEPKKISCVYSRIPVPYSKILDFNFGCECFFHCFTAFKFQTFNKTLQVQAINRFLLKGIAIINRYERRQPIQRQRQRGRQKRRC
ncbi:MAG: hypothetical protein ACI90V_013522 [Bacillariaceae sp.]|jgi:hypothetical protein